MSEQQKQTATPGPVTGIDISDVSPLTLPFKRDPFYRLRPPLCHAAMSLSLELAAMTYQLSLEEWLEAGWTDISIQVDDTLQSGVTASVQGESMRSVINSWKLHRARHALREANPVSQVLSALRQRERSDTIKAVTMAHRAPGGRRVIAIGFMGTGSRFYDWFSNLRFTTEDGFHKGFRQLTEYFEQSADRILFPDTAREMELERLTLADIITELKSPSSRFRLWMAGHSQGGAVMQVFAYSLINEMGVLPQNVIGYGFASPTVATAQLKVDPASYPMYHLLNTDDIVPKLGALTHLGLCLLYQAGDDFRQTAYGLSDDPRQAEARRDMRRFTAMMTDTLTAMEIIVSFCQTLLDEKGEEAINTLIDKKWTPAALDRVLSLAGDKAQDMLASVAAYCQQAYIQLSGHAMDEKRLLMLQREMTPIVRKYAMRELLSALHDISVPPHSIAREQYRVTGSYSYIVKRGYHSVRPFVWEIGPDDMPKQRFAGGVKWSDKPLTEASPKRRGKSPRKAAKPKPPGISQQRAARKPSREVRRGGPCSNAI